jgi:hypothetical protein
MLSRERIDPEHLPGTREKQRGTFVAVEKEEAALIMVALKRDSADSILRHLVEAGVIIEVKGIAGDERIVGGE